MSYATEVLADSPVLWYRMQEASSHLQDASGNGNHTTVIAGGATYSQTGPITNEPTDKGILFSGDDGFTAPHSSTLNVGDSFTLECWVKRTSGTGAQYICRKQHVGGFEFYLNGGFFNMSRAGSGSPIAYSGAGSMDTNWHHCVATKSGTTSKIYVDGADVTTLGTDLTISDSTSVIAIGYDPGGGSYLIATMDELALYDTALSQARVQAHYAAATAVATHEGEVVSPFSFGEVVAAKVVAKSRVVSPFEFGIGSAGYVPVVVQEIQPTLHIYLGSDFDPSTDDIFDEPDSWTEITDDVRSVTWTRGRQRDLDEIGAGSAHLVLRNEDRVYDPSNEDGPHFPLSERQLRIEADFNDETYYLFRGWVQNWRVKWDSNWADAYAEVEADVADGVALLQSWPVPTSVATVESISARIGRMLTIAGWPLAMRSLTGGGQMQAVTDPGRVWEHIQGCVRSDIDLGACFADGRGYMIFGSTTASGLTFGDADGELPYTSAGLDYGVDLVFSYVKVTREGEDATTQIAVGTGGANEKRGFRSYERTGVLCTTDAAALDLAEAILDEYGLPKARPEAIVVRPGRDVDLWEAVLGLDLEHTLTFTRRPPGGGDPFTQTMKVVGLQHTVGGDLSDWTATYRLSGAPLES